MNLVIKCKFFEWMNGKLDSARKQFKQDWLSILNVKYKNREKELRKSFESIMTAMWKNKADSQRKCAHMKNQRNWWIIDMLKQPRKQ